jgi:antitoxin component YwqK of YwqJK toxin-antitoxin module
MKKKLLIILISGLIGILILKIISKPFANSDMIIGRISNILNRNNSINLKCVGIDQKDVKVTWASDYTKPKLILENGKRSKKIEHFYGPNRFEIQLTNGLKFNGGHVKTKNWHSHRYEINVLKDSNGYKICFEAKGPDFEKYEQSFDLNGLLNGQEIGYNENGKYSYRGQYAKGLKQDSFIYYHNNGQIRVINEFLNDTLNGYVTNFDENGNLISKKKYINGQKIENDK